MLGLWESPCSGKSVQLLPRAEGWVCRTVYLFLRAIVGQASENRLLKDFLGPQEDWQGFLVVSWKQLRKHYSSASLGLYGLSHSGLLICLLLKAKGAWVKPPDCFWNRRCVCRVMWLLWEHQENAGVSSCFLEYSPGSSAQGKPPGPMGVWVGPPGLCVGLLVKLLEMAA